jgi:hypothetical protein
MTVTVTGYVSLKFTDDKTGELVEGTNVYFLHNSVDVVGRVATKKFFKKGSVLPELVLDSDYIMDYDPKGKLVSFDRVTLPAGKQ